MFFPGTYTDHYFGAYGVPVAQLDRTPPAELQKDVEPSDPLDRSNQLQVYTGLSLYPGFDPAPPPSVPLYWDMRGYSAIVLAYAVATGPILAGTRTIEIADDRGNPDDAEEWKAKAERDLLPVLEQAMEGALECLHFGYWLQEVIWELRDGRIAPVEFRSLLPGQAVLHKDRFGQFTGFQVNDEFRDARYAYLSVNDAHIDPIFGYSRNNNCRKLYWRADNSDLNGDRIERKASGIQMGIGIPMGASFTDDKGQPLLSQTMAQTLTNAAAKGETFTYPLTPFDKQSIKGKPELADIPAVKIQPFDWGNTAPAILAQIARMDAIDKRIMRAWRRPEREAMEGQHGTKAESGVQGQIGVTDSELIHARRCQQFNRQIVDRWLIANRGPGFEGTLYVKPTPLSDPQQQFLQSAALALLADPNDTETRAQLDRRALLHRTEMPLVTEEDAAAAMQKAEEEKQAAADQKMQQLKAAQQQQSPMNGNGHPNGNGTKLAASADTVLGRLAGLLEDDE